MKKILLTFAALVLSTQVAYAKELTIEVQKSTDLDLPVVSISSTVTLSGCSDETVQLSVVRSATSGAYVVNKLETEHKVLEEMPFSGCKALVERTYVATFATFASGLITLDVPEYVEEKDISVELQPMPMEDVF